jgi:hypothetical protein
MFVVKAGSLDTGSIAWFWGLMGKFRQVNDLVVTRNQWLILLNKS